MPWYRSAWRSRLNGRYARWMALRGVGAVAPGVTRGMHFYGRAVAVEAAAERLLHVERLVLEDPFTPEQAAFIERFCTKNDGGQGRYWDGPLRFADEHFLVREPILLGHTGKLLEREGRALITERGALENWNGDKLGMLREGAAIEGVAAPVRRFNSYFHFFFEFGLPFVALMESGAADGLPVRLALAEGARSFVVAAVEAMAKRYGLEIRSVGKGERLRCERALFLRRTRPCPDWYPVSRATADAARDLMAAQVGAPEGPFAEGLYLRRGREKLRNLENAAQVDALLAERGFEAQVPRGENIAEQIARARAARRIVAVHGAALTNLIYAQPGTEVFELFGQGACKSLYMLLCRMLELKHQALVGGPSDAHQNFAADLDGLAAALDAADR